MRIYTIIGIMIITNANFGQLVSEKHETENTVSKEGVIFSNFPVHPDDYAVDIQLIMDKAIEKFGYEEWRLVVLTSELHGHLGVYAIIGAKMGLYAREVLNAGHDELFIISNAGHKPPVSCLNDGLQVSTGSTLGHGLISIREDSIACPVADFTYGEKTIRISLKDSIYKDLERSIKEAIKLSGGLTDRYWQMIRELAIEIWLEYDRDEIFEIEKITR